MLFYKDLDKIVLNQHKKIPADELIVLSDSVGIELLFVLVEHSEVHANTYIETIDVNNLFQNHICNNV